jgi:hypothetical protein
VDSATGNYIQSDQLDMGQGAWLYNDTQETLSLVVDPKVEVKQKWTSKAMVKRRKSIEPPAPPRGKASAVAVVVEATNVDEVVSALPKEVVDVETLIPDTIQETMDTFSSAPPSGVASSGVASSGVASSGGGGGGGCLLK